MNTLFILLKRWPLGCLLFFCTACQFSQEKPKVIPKENDVLLKERTIDAALIEINDAKNLIHSGDLILRTGKDFTSDVMRKLSQHDKTYSHCGIASWEKDTLFVYHALGGDFNPDQKIRRDEFAIFCNPYENKGFGVYRYKILPEQQKEITHIAKQFYSRGVMFDMKFDLATDDRMYCSEFVYKTVEKATNGVISISTTTLNGIQFIAVDNLFYNSFAQEIKRINFR